MRTILGVLVSFMLTLLTAQAQSPNNISRSWSAPSMPSTDFDRSLRSNSAFQQYLVEQGAKSPGGGVGGGGTTVYNGPVTNTYNGPVSNSGSQVTNVQNLSEVTASGGSIVTTEQSSVGGTQSGAANATAATQTGGNVAPSTTQKPTSN